MDVKKFFVALIFFLGFAYSSYSHAASNLVHFNVDPNFEKNEDSKTTALLVKTSPNLYFYVQKDWWESQVQAKQQEVLVALDTLSLEFSSNIYPILTSVFGQEWRPGVDGDDKITVLFHAMKEGYGGYYRSTDEYFKLQVPASNEREMIYLPVAQVDNAYKLKVFLAHELTHMITFNQKDRLREVEEDVWLNEARAEYASSILGYNSAYEGSNLQSRVRDFLEKPADSLTEWSNVKYDYGVVNAFTQYLVDHYGINILSDSLKLKSAGIASLNEVLQKNGYQENFGQIFTDWTIANVVNNCTGNLHHCYLTQNLKVLRISPTLNFLPFSGNSSLTVTNVTKNWAGNWQKIIGGAGDLKLEFSSLAGIHFKVPYLIFDKENNYSVNFLVLDKNQKGQILIEDFGEKYSSLVIIPSLQDKTAGFTEAEFTYPYTFRVSISGQVAEEDPVLIQQLLAKIESLKQRIAALLAVAPGSPDTISCTTITSNLYVGVSNLPQVKCLQEFLKLQGSGIYPEGLVTGVFGNFTKAATMRFQKKYDIAQTGFVGVITRTKINELLKTK